jgi:hypothetical protein
VSDATDKPSRPVSMSKSEKIPDGAVPAARPRTIPLIVAAMVLSGIAAIGASTALFGQHAFLLRSVTKSEVKAKKVKDASFLTPSQKHDVINQVNKIPSSQLIASIVLLFALSLVAFAVWRGRYWGRWAVIGLWVICSYTGTLSGLNSVFTISADLPNAFKIPAAAAGLLFIAALVLVFVPVSGKYFAQNRPVRPAGAPARRGIFAPRVAVDRPGRPGTAARPARPARPGSKAAAALTSSAADRGEAHVERSRAKNRAAANAESIALGAELARKRAKASKSRRTDG